MEGTDYRSIIENMTWSYSRIKSFYDCPYRWFLKYIHPHVLIQQVFNGKRPTKADVDSAYVRGILEMDDAEILYTYLGVKSKKMFFASYGTFMHKILELYYKGKLTPGQMCDMYLQEFRSQVVGRAPNKTVFTNYFKSGIQYLRNFKAFPYNTVAVEKRIDFSLDGVPFVGHIDYLGEKNGDLIILDNKSKTLKPRSGRTKPTKTDEELDDYLVQLYLYSAAVKHKYGKFPVVLGFNCFRAPALIEEPFKEEAFMSSKNWLVNKVGEIKTEKEFRPSCDYFKCKHLCEMQDLCEFCEISGKK